MRRTLSRSVLSAILSALVVVGLAVMHTNAQALEHSASSPVVSKGAVTAHTDMAMPGLADMAMSGPASAPMPSPHDEHMGQMCQSVLPPLLALSLLLLLIGLRRVLTDGPLQKALDRLKLQRRQLPHPRGPDRATLCVMRV